jgi:hypothetical protein
VSAGDHSPPLISSHVSQPVSLLLSQTLLESNNHTLRKLPLRYAMRAKLMSVPDRATRNCSTLNSLSFDCSSSRQKCSFCTQKRRRDVSFVTRPRLRICLGHSPSSVPLSASERESLPQISHCTPRCRREILSQRSH